MRILYLKEYSFSVALEADPLGGVTLKLALMLVIKVWNIWGIKNGINMDRTALRGFSV